MSNPKATGLNPNTKVDVNIHVTFEETTEFGRFKDSLVYTKDEYDNLPPNEVAVKLRERIDAWRFKHIHNKPKK